MVPGSGRFPWRRDRLLTAVFLGFPVAQLVKNLPAKKKKETQVQSMGSEFNSWVGKILEKGKATIYKDDSLVLDIFKLSDLCPSNGRNMTYSVLGQHFPDFCS